MEAQVDKQEILDIVEKHDAACGGLIAMLEEVQELYGYLPEDALRLVAKAANRSLVDVYGVATFYKAFSLQPRGKHHVCACEGTACHVRGAPMVVEELKRQLAIDADETTADGKFTLETVSCLGACALGPIVVTDGVYHSKVNVAGVKHILETTVAEDEDEEQQAAEAEEAEPMVAV